MSVWVMYIILAVTVIAAVIVKRDTRKLIHRSDEIQKSLNEFIKKERGKHVA